MNGRERPERDQRRTPNTERRAHNLSNLRRIFAAERLRIRLTSGEKTAANLVSNRHVYTVTSTDSVLSPCAPTLHRPVHTVSTSFVSTNQQLTKAMNSNAAARAALLSIDESESQNVFAMQCRPNYWQQRYVYEAYITVSHWTKLANSLITPTKNDTIYLHLWLTKRIYNFNIQTTKSENSAQFLHTLLPIKTTGLKKITPLPYREHRNWFSCNVYVNKLKKEPR